MYIQDFGLARSKWEQHLALDKDPVLKRMVIPTEMFSKENFLKYLKQYSKVFLKPMVGGKGEGIIIVKRMESGFLIKKGIYNQTVYDMKEILTRIQNQIGDRKYVVQRGIDLMKVGDRLVDFRILLMKPRGRWRLMGMIGKQASKNKEVTNHAQGGQAISMEGALKMGLNLSKKEIQQLKNRLVKLGFYLAENYYDYGKCLGLDIGVDTYGRVWIIEGNTRPGFQLFRFHEDQNLYGKILRFKRYILNRGLVKR